MNNTIIQENSGLSSFYSKVYGFVGMGIAISALVSGLMLTIFQTALVEILLHYSWIYYGAIFIELALVWSASSRGLRNSPAALPLFLSYSALNGFTMSFIVAMYTGGVVFKAFAVSAAVFLVMAAMGVIIKKDLSGMGRAMIAGLIGIVIASFVNIFLGSDMIDYIVSYVSVVIFAGLIAWDNQKIRYVYEQTGGQAGLGWAISLALSLYLDFINLFLSILRIFGRND